MSLDEVLRCWSVPDLVAALDTLDFLFDLELESRKPAEEEISV